MKTTNENIKKHHSSLHCNTVKKLYNNTVVQRVFLLIDLSNCILNETFSALNDYNSNLTKLLSKRFQSSKLGISKYFKQNHHTYQISHFTLKIQQAMNTKHSNLIVSDNQSVVLNLGESLNCRLPSVSHCVWWTIQLTYEWSQCYADMMKLSIVLRG